MLVDEESNKELEGAKNAVSAPEPKEDTASVYEDIPELPAGEFTEEDVNTVRLKLKRGDFTAKQVFEGLAVDSDSGEVSDFLLDVYGNAIKAAQARGESDDDIALELQRDGVLPKTPYRNPRKLLKSYQTFSGKKHSMAFFDDVVEVGSEVTTDTVITVDDKVYTVPTTPFLETILEVASTTPDELSNMSADTLASKLSNLYAARQPEDDTSIVPTQANLLWNLATGWGLGDEEAKQKAASLMAYQNNLILATLTKNGYPASIRQGALFIEKDGQQVPLNADVWQSIKNGLWDSKGEIAGAVAGALRGGTLGAVAGPLGGVAGAVAGGFIGAGLGRTSDVVALALQTNEQIKASVLVDEFVQAGSLDAIFSVLGITATQFIKGSYKMSAAKLNAIKEKALADAASATELAGEHLPKNEAVKLVQVLLATAGREVSNATATVGSFAGKPLARLFAGNPRGAYKRMKAITDTTDESLIALVKQYEELNDVVLLTSYARNKGVISRVKDIQTVLKVAAESLPDFNTRVANALPFIADEGALLKTKVVTRTQEVLDALDASTSPKSVSNLKKSLRQYEATVPEHLDAIKQKANGLLQAKVTTQPRDKTLDIDEVLRWGSTNLQATDTVDYKKLKLPATIQALEALTSDKVTKAKLALFSDAVDPDKVLGKLPAGDVKAGKRLLDVKAELTILKVSKEQLAQFRNEGSFDKGATKVIDAALARIDKLAVRTAAKMRYKGHEWYTAFTSATKQLVEVAPALDLRKLRLGEFLQATSLKTTNTRFVADLEDFSNYVAHSTKQSFSAKSNVPAFQTILEVRDRLVALLPRYAGDKPVSSAVEGKLKEVERMIRDATKEVFTSPAEGKKWLASYRRANVEGAKLQAVQDTAMFKGITKASNTDAVITALLKEASALDVENLMRVFASLTPKVRSESEVSLVKAVVAKHASTTGASEKVLDFRSLRDSLAKMTFKQQGAKDFKRLINRLADVYVHDQALVKAVAGTPGDSVGGANSLSPKMVAMRNATAKLVGYVARVFSGKSALPLLLGKVLENPLESKSFTELAEAFAKNSIPTADLHRLAELYASRGVAKDYSARSIYTYAGAPNVRAGHIYDISRSTAGKAGKAVGEKVEISTIATTEEATVLLGRSMVKTDFNNATFIQTLRDNGFKGVALGSKVLVFKRRTTQ